MKKFILCLFAALIAAPLSAAIIHYTNHINGWEIYSTRKSAECKVNVNGTPLMIGFDLMLAVNPKDPASVGVFLRLSCSDVDISEITTVFYKEDKVTPALFRQADVLESNSEHVKFFKAARKTLVKEFIPDFERKNYFVVLRAPGSNADKGYFQKDSEEANGIAALIKIPGMNNGKFIVVMPTDDQIRSIKEMIALYKELSGAEKKEAEAPEAPEAAEESEDNSEEGKEGKEGKKDKKQEPESKYSEIAHLSAEEFDEAVSQHNSGIKIYNDSEFTAMVLLAKDNSPAAKAAIALTKSPEELKKMAIAARTSQVLYELANDSHNINQIVRTENAFRGAIVRLERAKMARRAAQTMVLSNCVPIPLNYALTEPLADGKYKLLVISGSKMIIKDLNCGEEGETKFIFKISELLSGNSGESGDAGSSEE